MYCMYCMYVKDLRLMLRLEMHSAPNITAAVKMNKCYKENTRYIHE